MSHGITDTNSMFSVNSQRKPPRHGLGVVLDEYPQSIDEALEKAGLGWRVNHGDVLVVKRPEWTDDFGTKHPPELIPANGFKANIREDTGDVLGIVSDEYEVVDNRAAFAFLDALINSDMHFETAGSLWGGRRVWVLARLPEYVELGGDLSALYVYVANSHDGSMAVTAAVTPIRIVCASTLGAAVRQAEHGVNAGRTFRFRHTGNLEAKFAEARQVLGMTINYQQQFKELADRTAREHIAEWAFERACCGICGRSTRTWERSRAPTGRVRSSGCWRSSADMASPATRPAIAPVRSGWRSTQSPSTSTMAGDTPAGPTRSSGHSRTRRSSSERSSWCWAPD
jgi:phage/plasmid-like protein (TIGR03299 family)